MFLTFFVRNYYKFKMQLSFSYPNKLYKNFLTTLKEHNIIIHFTLWVSDVDELQIGNYLNYLITIIFLIS